MNNEITYWISYKIVEDTEKGTITVYANGEHIAWENITKEKFMEILRSHIIWDD